MSAREATPQELARESEAAEIRLKVIENGLIVKQAGRWYTYPGWDEAAKDIKARVDALLSKRGKA